MNWIRVEDELPKKDEEVLGAWEDRSGWRYEIMIYLRRDETGRTLFESSEGEVIHRVTHWARIWQPERE